MSPVFLENYHAWEWFGEAPKLELVSEVRVILCEFFPLTLCLDPNSLQLGSETLGRLGSPEDCALSLTVRLTLGRDTGKHTANIIHNGSPQ